MLGVASPRPSYSQAPPTLIDSYIARPDPEFRLELVSNHSTDDGTLFSFRLTSQVWRGIPWTHQLRIYEPAGLPADRKRIVLLFITGGSTDRQASPDDHAQGFLLARACNARVAVLPQVPNQPLLDGKVEDDLIGETFVMYLKTQEPDLPLLFPMVKSAVRAMDAVQQWAVSRNERVEGFVVSGASKRGWTTWLTGAHDPRVRAIAPMVIPTLNMKAQSRHQLDSWGKYSEQIEDYTRRGLTEKFDDPIGRELWRSVDPFSYLDRIKVPVFQINGTNDRYWTVDSVNLFWNDIQAPWKGIVSLPNAGHGLDQNRDWAIDAIGALVRSTATGQPLPRFATSSEVKDGRPKINIDALPAPIRFDQPEPVRLVLWEAAAPTRDFREARWEATHQYKGSEFGLGVGLLARPVQTGYSAVFVDITYTIDGLDFHLATPIHVFGPEGEILPRLAVESEAKP
jgi:PhoPQ-activated pathogenicity-related protein